MLVGNIVRTESTFERVFPKAHLNEKHQFGRILIQAFFSLDHGKQRLGRTMIEGWIITGKEVAFALKDKYYAFQMAFPQEVRRSDDDSKNARIVWVRNATLGAFQTIKSKGLVSPSLSIQAV